MFIWSDPQRLDWPDDVRSELEAMGRSDVTGKMPVFCHGRPEGGPDSPYFVGLWEYNSQIIQPTWPLPVDDLYAEVVMKGLTTMVPGLAPYLVGLPEHTVDGGYYTKTRENRPLIGPCGPEGLSVVCGFSGFGVMVAAGAGDLAARHISGAALPSYSSDFLLSRYERPEYLAEIDRLASGQL
jgi:glycine/D-amino acid oxidase-like deaminating enzyme